VRARLGAGAGLALVLLVVLAALPSGSAAPAPGPAATAPAVFQNFTVSGHVADANSHAAIPNAQVRANSGPSTVTASDGNYTLLVPSGVETLQYSANGFKKGSITIFVKTNVGNVNVFLLPFAYTVSGVVTDAKTHAPIAGATVAVEPGGATVTTPASGQYSFGLENGTFYLVVSASGHLSQNVSVRVAGAPVAGQVVVLDRSDAPSSGPSPTAYLVAAGAAALVVAAAAAFLIMRRRRTLASLRPPEAPPAHVAVGASPTPGEPAASDADRPR
jgi:hypothetical protein